MVLKLNFRHYEGAFSNSGKILFYFQDEESKTIMIQYKTRREAETAMLKSNQFTERSLQLTWHTISLGDSTGNLNYYRIEMILVIG